MNNELEIVLKLVDEASEKLRGIYKGVKKDTEDLEKKSKKATESLREGMKNASKEVKALKRELFIITLTIGALFAVTREWAKHNWETMRAMDSMKESMHRIGAAIGSLFAPLIVFLANLLETVLVPAFEKLVEVLQKTYLWIVDKLSYAFNFWVSLFSALKEGKTLTEAYSQATREAAENTARFMEQAKTGFDQNIFLVDALIQKMRQLSEAYRVTSLEVTNAMIMDQQTTLQASINLLQTLKSMHKTVWGSIFDFVNMGLQKMSSGFAAAVTAIAMGTKRAREAWRELGQTMIAAVIDFVVQYGIQALIAMTIGKLLTASVISQANSIAAAWLPAAIFASIATQGGASAAGLAGFTTATGAGMGIGMAAINLGKITVSKPAEKAEGGWVGLRGPEHVIVGERGPEYVVPNHRLNKMGSQTSIHIEINNPIVSSQDNINYLVEEVSQRISHETERVR